jgi:methionyl-tRNA formyltransferase
VIPRPQPEEGATLTRPLRRADGRLDPARTAEQLERQVRAYLPWPGSFLETGDARVAVLSASVAPSRPGDAVGALVRDGDGLALVTSDGRLLLVDVQPSGGRPMTAAEFVRGRPSIVGRTVRG